MAGCQHPDRNYGAGVSKAHTALLRQVKEALEWDGWQVEPIQGVYNRKGIFDLYADRLVMHTIAYNRVIWIEVKTGKGKLSPAQIEFGNRRKESAVEHYEIRRLEELQELGIVKRVMIE
jgi:hypothetical protein